MADPPAVGDDVDDLDRPADQPATRRPFAAEFDRVVAPVEQRGAVTAEIELEAETVDHHDRSVHALELREVAILQDAGQADPPGRPVARRRDGDIANRPTLVLDRDRMVVLGGEADERAALDRRLLPPPRPAYPRARAPYSPTHRT